MLFGGFEQDPDSEEESNITLDGFSSALGYLRSADTNTVTCTESATYNKYIRFGDLFEKSANPAICNEVVRYTFNIKKCSDDRDASCIMIGINGVEDESTFWICNDGSTCLEYDKPSHFPHYYKEAYLERLDSQNNETRCKFTSGDIVSITVDCNEGRVFVQINDEARKEYFWATKYINSFQFLLNLTQKMDSLSIIESKQIDINKIDLETLDATQYKKDNSKKTANASNDTQYKKDNSRKTANASSDTQYKNDRNILSNETQHKKDNDTNNIIYNNDIRNRFANNAQYKTNDAHKYKKDNNVKKVSNEAVCNKDYFDTKRLSNKTQKRQMQEEEKEKNDQTKLQQIIETLRRDLEQANASKKASYFANFQDSNSRSKNIELQNENQSLKRENKRITQKLDKLQNEYQILEVENNSLKRRIEEMLQKRSNYYNNNHTTNKNEDHKQQKVILSYKDAQKLKVKNKEMYLSDEEFMKIFGMTKMEFSKLKRWKQTQYKRNKGLF